MRSREEIEDNEIGRVGGMRIGEDYKKLMLEVLLDIRDLLVREENWRTSGDMNRAAAKPQEK